jgi:hypothetical protein
MNLRASDISTYDALHSLDMLSFAAVIALQLIRDTANRALRELSGKGYAVHGSSGLTVAPQMLIPPLEAAV